MKVAFNEKRQTHYKTIQCGKKQVREHRAIMEHQLGRKLKPNEIVHHLDGNKQNNSIENLVLMTRSEHMRKHRANIEAAREKNIKWHIDHVALIELYVNQGLSASHSAAIMGIPASTINWYISKNGIKHKEGLCPVNRWR